MNQSIGTSAAWLTITKFINVAISMVTAMLLSRYRTLEEYGTYSQLLMVVTITTTIFMMGLSGSVNFFLSRAKDEDEQRIFLSNYYTISTIISLITGIALLVVSPGIAEYFDNPLIETFVYFLAISPWINIIGSSIDNIFIIYNKIKILTLYRIGYSLSILLIVLLSVKMGLSFGEFLIALIGVQIIFTLAVYIIIGNLIESFKPRLDLKLIKKIFSFSLPLGLALTLGIFHIETDKLMIGYLYDTETLAIFTNASREIPITIVVSSITAVIIPLIVRFVKNNQNEKAVELWKNATTFSYIFLCFFAGMLFAFAPQVISILYSDKYLTGIDVFRICSIKVLLQATNYAIILTALGKTKMIFRASIISLVLNIVLNYFFNLLFGLNGFAIATLISTAFVAFFQIYLSSVEIKIPIKSIFPWREIFYITIINILISIITLASFKLLNEFFNQYTSMVIIIPGVIMLYYWFVKKRIIHGWNYLNSEKTE